MPDTVQPPPPTPAPIPAAFRNLAIDPARGVSSLQHRLAALVADVMPWPSGDPGPASAAAWSDASDRLESLVLLCQELTRLLSTGMRSGQLRDILTWVAVQAEARVKDNDGQEESLADYHDAQGRACPSRNQFMRQRSIRVAICKMLTAAAEAEYIPSPVLPETLAGMDEIRERIAESYDLTTNEGE